MKHLSWIILVAGIGMLPACRKKDFLDAKPSSELFIPSTLDDFQELLDRDAVINETPILGELCSDNYYPLTSNLFWQQLNLKEHYACIWAPDVYQGLGNVGDWNTPYQAVFYANVVLDGIDNVSINSGNQQRWKAIKGAAYFTRAYAFFNLAQVFAPPYDAATAGSDMGIPLRLSSGVDEVSVRASVKSTYNQVIADLTKALDLLPDTVILSNRNRPSKPAAMALLARTYLSMRDYTNAGIWSNNSLALYDSLIDYTLLFTSGTLFPFGRTNVETMYLGRLLSTTNVLKAAISSCIIDSTLCRMYDPNDLRRVIFFTNSAYPNLRGSYTGSVYCFSGLATDEMFLTRAECYARAGNTLAAMSDLNKLLQTRWKTNTYIPFTATTPDSALAIILSERRKELPFRGLRWVDLRRLNKEGYNITLSRTMLGTQYTLAPNDLRYVLLIPPDVISLTGMPQNPR